mgnify:CR=1 FL=1
MNTLVIVLIAAVCLFGAYMLYGRWLANKWGIDPSAKTPAVVHEDGRDYVPTDGWTVFAHQFSSIAGAGLDVLCKEPMNPENPLLKIQDSNKLIITPHIAWAAKETRFRVVDEVVKNIQRFQRDDRTNRVY